MSLMSRYTGKGITDPEHLKQSIIDILTTRVGSRVGIREYGSRLPDRIDQPINRLWIMNVYSDIAVALYKWEPRIRVLNVAVDATQAAQGIVGITLSGVYLPDGNPIKIDNLALDLRNSGISQNALFGTRTF